MGIMEASTEVVRMATGVLGRSEVKKVGSGEVMAKERSRVKGESVK